MANPAEKVTSLDGSSHSSDVVPVTTGSATGVSSVTSNTTTTALVALTVHASSSFSSDSHQTDPSPNEGTQEQKREAMNEGSSSATTVTPDTEQLPDPEPGRLASGKPLRQETTNFDRSLKGFPVRQETQSGSVASLSKRATNDTPNRAISSERYSVEGAQNLTAVEDNQVFVGDNLEKANITSQDVEIVMGRLQAVCQENQSVNAPPDLNNTNDFEECGVVEKFDREGNGQLAIHDQQKVFKEVEEIDDEEKVETEEDQVREPQGHCQNDPAHTVPPPQPWRECEANVKPGNLIAVRRYGGAYRHYMVYIGNGEVIHATGGIPDWIRCIKGEIKEEKVEDVLKPDDLVLIEHGTWEGNNPLSTHEIVRRACGEVGKEGFNLFDRNCEHLARWCRYDKACSTQADTLHDIIIRLLKSY